MVGSLIGLHQGNPPPKTNQADPESSGRELLCQSYRRWTTPEGKLRGQLKWRELVALWPARG